MLACDWPTIGPECRFVALPDGPGVPEGNGSYENPWRSITALNAAIATPEAIPPGTIINFRRGDTFDGNILFDGVGGTAASPITLQPFAGDELDEPRPIINAADGTGILVRNAAGFVISNLEIAGSFDPGNPDSPSLGNGIEFRSDPGYGTHERIELVDLRIHGFGGCGPHKQFPCVDQTATGSGIYIIATQPTTDPEYIHFTDIKIYSSENTPEPTKIFGNEHAGINIADARGFSDEPYGPAHEQVYIHHVDVYGQKPRNQDPQYPAIGGLGITLGGVTGAVVERSVIHENGRDDYVVPNGGLGSHHSDHVLLQYNSVWGQRSLGDGIGLGFDRFTTHSILQFNYTRENSGPGIMIGGKGLGGMMVENNIIRYNIVQNDSRSYPWGGIFFESIWASHVDVYGNTVYMNDPLLETQPPALGIHSDQSEVPCTDPDPCLLTPTINIYNNMLYTSSPAVPVLKLWPLFEAYSENITIKGNNYVSDGGSVLTIAWGATTYTSLAAFRAGTGHEWHDFGTGIGVFVGASVDPNLASIGLAGIVDLTTIDVMHEQVLAPYYQLDDPPTAVAEDGMDLFAVIGADWWDPDGYWLANWADQWHEIPQDGFDVQIDLFDPVFSMGASQDPFQP